MVKLFHDQISEQNATAMDLTVSGLSMKANLDGIQAKLIHQVNVLNFGIEFDPVDVNKVYMTGQLSVLFGLPSNIQMAFKVLRTSINFIMKFNDEPSLGQMILQNLHVKHNRTTNELLVSFDRQELIILNELSFKKFAANLVLAKNVSVRIEGLTTAIAETQIGKIALSNIPINDTIRLVGYNQFNNGLMNIKNIDLIGAISSNALVLRVKAEISNPSVVNILNAGRLSLNLCNIMDGESLGIVHISPFYLQPQGYITVLEADGIFTITSLNRATARDFISRMISGIDSPVELRGTLVDNSIGTSIPLLSSAIAGLFIRTNVPGLSSERTLVREIILKRLTSAEIFGIPIGRVKALSARIRISNPFSTPLVIQKMNVRADFGPTVNQNQQIAIVQSDTPIAIGPHEEFITSYMDATLSGKLTTMIPLLKPLFAGTARLSLSGVVDVSIGRDFTLSQLPLTLFNVTTNQEPS